MENRQFGDRGYRLPSVPCTTNLSNKFLYASRPEQLFRQTNTRIIGFVQDLIRNRVLLVDDNPSVRRSLRLRLERAGIEVAEAENGRESIGMAPGYRPRVIILDFCMPEMNGLEVAPQLKHLLPRSFIILFTMHSTEVLETEAQRLGVTAVVSKDRAGIDLLPLAERLLAA
jgi:CheY-like chemotaxis protein